MNFVRNNKLIILILLITLIKGIVWSYATPLFQAPDEQVHYATVQHYAEPASYAPKSTDFPLAKTTLSDIKTQNLSPELRNFLEKTQFDQVRFHKDKIQNFAVGSYNGRYEDSIKSAALPRFVENYPAWTVNYPPLFYQGAAALENTFSGASIIERFYLLRLCSVVLVTVFILFSYLTFRELNFAKASSSLLAGAVSFQPMLSFIGSSFNVDNLLIATFGIFLLGAVRFISGRYVSWGVLTNIILMLVGLALAILAKPSGYFLLVAAIFLIVSYVLSYRFKTIKDNKYGYAQIFTGAAALILLVVGTVFIYRELKSDFFPGFQPLSLLPAYAAHQLKYPILLGHSWFYWGDFGWLDTPISRYAVYLIWAVLALGTGGIIVYLYQKIRFWKELNEQEKTLFLQIVFLILVYVGFGLAIHAVNFQQVNPANVADESGAIAIQGRYFFPVIAIKFFLVFWGLVILWKFMDLKLRRLVQIAPKLVQVSDLNLRFLGFSGSSRRLEPTIKVALFLFLAMLVLNFVSLFGYLIPRFYVGSDIISLGELVRRLSQYKPLWLKGQGIIAFFLLYILMTAWFVKVSAAKVKNKIKIVAHR